MPVVMINFVRIFIVGASPRSPLGKPFPWLPVAQSQRTLAIHELNTQTIIVTPRIRIPQSVARCRKGPLTERKLTSCQSVTLIGVECGEMAVSQVGRDSFE